MPAEFYVSDDKKLYNIPLVHSWICQTYWAQERTIEQTRLALENSAYWFGIYQSSDHKQAGCARLVSDKLTFAYLSDVFIDPAYRGKGLGKMLIEGILACPEIQALKRVSLYTKTPQFYKGFFTEYLFQPEEPFYLHRVQH